MALRPTGFQGRKTQFNDAVLSSLPLSLPFDGHFVPVRSWILRWRVIQVDRQGLMVLWRGQFTNADLASPSNFGELDLRRACWRKGGLEGEVRIAAS